MKNKTVLLIVILAVVVLIAVFSTALRKEKSQVTKIADVQESMVPEKTKQQIDIDFNDAKAVAERFLELEKNRDYEEIVNMMYTPEDLDPSKIEEQNVFLTVFQQPEVNLGMAIPQVIVVIIITFSLYPMIKVYLAKRTPTYLFLVNVILVTIIVNFFNIMEAFGISDQGFLRLSLGPLLSFTFLCVALAAFVEEQINEKEQKIVDYAQTLETIITNAQTSSTQLKPFKLKCISCGHNYEQSLNINVSDFFA